MHFVLSRIARWRIVTTVVMLGAALLLAYSMQALLPIAVESLGRDVTLSGRSQIWSFFYNATRDDWWLGRGYGAYQTDQALISQARDTLWGTIRSPHNAYLALALGTGWASVMLYLVWHVRVIGRAVLSRARFAATAPALFVLAAAFLVHGMFEISGGPALSVGLALLLICLAAFLSETRPRAY